MGLPEVAGAVMLLGLAAYATTGGADFGGGVWDALARGPRAEAQRRLVERALAPIWEVNHVWLIFVIVVMFSAFPAAFAAIGVALYAPLSLALFGIVLRGAGFVFRQYGLGDAASTRRWGRVFGVASLLSPVFLGMGLGAVTGGALGVDAAGAVTDGAAWLGVFPLTVGLFVLVLFAFLAAVYLTNEADTPELVEDFRRRALGAGVALGALSLAVRAAAATASPRFGQALYDSWWSGVAQGVVAVLAIGALVALAARRYRVARALAVLQALGIVGAWGLAQHPYVIAPGLTLEAASAPAATQRIVLVVLGLGGVVLIPLLYWMMRLFKAPARP
jgi:cytochrome d ubiquinol oxidase subunit II